MGLDYFVRGYALAYKVEGLNYIYGITSEKNSAELEQKNLKPQLSS